MDSAAANAPDCGPATAPPAGGARSAGRVERARSHVRSHVAADQAAQPAPTRATGMRLTANEPVSASGIPQGSGPGPASASPSAPAAAPAPSPSAPVGVAEGGGGGGGAPGTITVRAEEALIVLLVLVLWVAAIALFFNRWGKIRMLEPYQPKYEAPHRGSCPLVDCSAAPALQHRSYSKFNLSGCGLGGKDSGLYSSMPSPHNLLRPRQNSVFVGSSATMVTLPLNPPRKAKSAMDIQTLVLAECGPAPALHHHQHQHQHPAAGAAAPGGSFDGERAHLHLHLHDPLPDSNFSAAIAKIDTFKVTNV